MEFGMFLEFPVTEGRTEKDAFDDSFVLINEAEKLGVDSVSYTHLTLPTILLV